MLKPARKYDFTHFTGDCFGGAIAALIALPYGLAMASLMGLPPALGLFTSLLTAPITALLGRNPVLIGGTSTVTVPFLAMAVRQQGVGGAAKVTLVAAVVMLVIAVLKLGRYIAKVPHAVVSGFSCGIGGMMIVSQLRTMFGLSIANPPVSTLGQLMQFVENIGGTRYAPLILAAMVIAASFAVARLSPKFPAPLIGVVLAFAAGSIFGLHEKEVGRLPLEIPAFAGFTWSPADVYTVLPSGIALALVAAMNLLITSRVVEHFRGKHRPMRPGDADAELGAYGIANVCAGVFGAPMSVGIPARSLANVRCGGTTRVSNFVHALFLLLFLSAGKDLVSHIPIPALAGVTAYVGICLLEWGTWHRLPKMRRADAAAFLATAGATLVWNAVAAVLIGWLIASLPALLERLKSSDKSAPGIAAADAR